MLHKLLITALLAVTLMTGSLSATAQAEATKNPPENVPALLRKANTAYAAADYESFRNALLGLHNLRPNNSDYMVQLVIAHALMNEKSQAYDLMLRMQQQGLAYDFSVPESTMNIRGTQVFDYVNDLMKKAGDPMGESETVFVLPGSVSMPEAIAWDQGRQKFLIGTISEGSILAVDKDGQLSELLKADAENGLWAIFDILVDQARKRLWVTSASMPGFARFDPVEKGRSALFEFDLETLELIHRYPVPVDGQSHNLGNMVLGPNGDIFIVDRNLPLIYSKPADGTKLKAVMALKNMISMRGIAMQPDGRIMYVADREMGITVIDTQTGRAGMLARPDTLNLGGIDGLYLHNNRLFVIQNGIKPQRVMRLELDASGMKVEAVRPMAVSQPEFDFPSFGTVQGEYLYYFANSQWSGKADQQKAVTVLRTPLDSSQDLVQPDMRRFLEQQAKSAKQQTPDAEKN